MPTNLPSQDDQVCNRRLLLFAHKRGRKSQSRGRLLRHPGLHGPEGLQHLPGGNRSNTGEQTVVRPLPPAAFFWGGGGGIEKESRKGL